MKKRVLIVEDEADIQDVLHYNFEREGYEVVVASDGAAAIIQAQKAQPDLILLDLMIPEKDGLTVCRELKQMDETKNIPIIMVTAKGDESDIVIGLEMGADDYICKPFSIKILLARAKAVLRRKTQEETGTKSEPLRIGPLEILLDRHKVLLNKKSIELTASEFNLLHFLASHPGWVRTREQIIDAVRGMDYAVTDRSIDVQIVGLRRKLGKHSDLIETVRGVGYRFKEIT